MSSSSSISDATAVAKESVVCSINVGSNSSLTALSLCRNDNTKVVVAGRSLLKVFEYDESEWRLNELLNLQVGGRRGEVCT